MCGGFTDAPARLDEDPIPVAGQRCSRRPRPLQRGDTPITYPFSQTPENSPGGRLHGEDVQAGGAQVLLEGDCASGDGGNTKTRMEGFQGHILSFLNTFLSQFFTFEQFQKIFRFGAEKSTALVGQRVVFGPKLFLSRLTLWLVLVLV